MAVPLTWGSLPGKTFRPPGTTATKPKPMPSYGQAWSDFTSGLSNPTLQKVGQAAYGVGQKLGQASNFLGGQVANLRGRASDTIGSAVRPPQRPQRQPSPPGSQSAPTDAGMWGWQPPWQRMPTIQDRGIAEGYANRNMLLGGHAGFAGQMQNAMSQIGAMNLANQQASLEQRKYDMLNRMMGGGRQQFSNIPDMQLPSGRGSVYMSPYYEGATPAAPEGMSAADAARYADATRGAEASARTRIDLAGTAADAEQALASRMADSDVIRQLNALNTQRMGSQMGYQRGLRGLMAAGV